MSFLIDRPHESGQMTCKFWDKLVSSQAGKKKKDPIIQTIRSLTSKVKYLLSSDVSLRITWFINEDERIESDKSADIDNIIKPILDAFCGRNGIIIDDCQIQSICSHWEDRYAESEHFQIEISYEPDAFFLKEKISFVQLQKALCMPFYKDVRSDELKMLLEIFEKQLKFRDELLAKGVNYFSARSVMSIQRLFHKSRLKGFEVVKLEDLKASIELPL
ncbi:MAG: RusA family crossover junction endodeoxyribonuclease [Acidobacteria bacterium]|jgi:Holliday junction resolvase RusA-like endonuclease|nr:RusA family crossover junction endodeoxyribonuclease [Acidobacteriota bacterium]